MQPRRRNDQGFTDHRQVGRWYDAKYKEMGSGWLTPAEELENHLYVLGLPADARGLRIVDLGFGDGQLLVTAAKSGADCYGVDLSDVGTRMALDRYTAAFGENSTLGTFMLFNKPMEDTGLDAESFDFAISLGSMEHALRIAEAVVEMERILKPGGRFLLYVPNEKWLHEDQPLETTAPSEWWIDLLAKAGLVVTNDELMNDNNRITGMKPHRD